MCSGEYQIFQCEGAQGGNGKGDNISTFGTQGAEAAGTGIRMVSNITIPTVAVPWFWSDPSDWTLQSVGLAAPQDDSVVRDDGAVMRFSGSTLSAVEIIYNARTPVLARKILAQAPVNREQLAAVNYDIAAV